MANTQEPRARRLLYGITNWALFVAGIANLAAGTYAAVTANTALAATSLTAGLILLFAATIDRFESVKGLGIEAKTKQLDQKIAQADDALKRSRQLAELSGAALIDLNSRSGRWDSSPSPRDFVALADRVRELLASLGSSQQQIDLALESWARTLCFDMATAAMRNLRQAVADKIQALERERDSIGQPVQPNDPRYVSLSEQIRALYVYRESRLHSLHTLSLSDYPDKFMSFFDDVPIIDSVQVQSFRQHASRFSAGMTSLVKSRNLFDRELWIEELTFAQAQ
jgi:hypothetical protein